MGKLNMAEMKLILVISCFMLPLVASQGCTSNFCSFGGTCLERPFEENPLCICPPGTHGPTCSEFQLGSCDGQTPGEYTINQTSGTLLSPNYPNQYPDSSYCSYFIVFPGAQQIRLSFNVIDVEEIKDDVIIGAGQTLSFDPRDYLRIFSDELFDEPDETIPSDVVWVWLITDRTDPGAPYKGFNISFLVDLDECQFNPDICAPGSTCEDLEFSYRCNDINQCTSGPCLNGGACNDGINMYTCTCSTGFTGTNCMTDIDECMSMPCLNGGTCTDAVNSYTCDCVAGYFGTFCQIDIDECVSMPCLNGGTCTDAVDSYTCDCVTGYIGPFCGIAFEACLSMPCQNGGICVDGTNEYFCVCPGTGFTGKNCQTNIDECVSMPCLNGGTCTDAVNSYTCDCVPGYSGTFCQIDINECASNPCENGGTCLDFPGLYICNCVKGFSGIHCEINDDDCRSNPCLNGATCIDGAQSFTCICPSRFSGTTCAMDVIYITAVAVVLLILLVLSIILCYREKKWRKKTQDTNTEPNLALPLGPVPQRPGSTPYDTRIVMTAPTHGPSHDGQLNHVYADVL